MADRHLEPVERLRRFSLQQLQEPFRHLHTSCLRRRPLRPVEQASCVPDERLPKPCLASRFVERLERLQRDSLRGGRHPDANPGHQLSMRQRLHWNQAGFVANAILHGEQPKAWHLADERVGAVERLQRVNVQPEQNADRQLHTARLWRERMQSKR